MLDLNHELFLCGSVSTKYWPFPSMFTRLQSKSRLLIEIQQKCRISNMLYSTHTYVFVFVRMLLCFCIFVFLYFCSFALLCLWRIWKSCKWKAEKLYARVNDCHCYCRFPVGGVAVGGQGYAYFATSLSYHFGQNQLKFRQNIIINIYSFCHLLKSRMITLLFFCLLFFLFIEKSLLRWFKSQRSN